MNSCEHCREVHSAKQHWATWMCMAFANYVPNPVTGELEPYHRCKEVRRLTNDAEGNCRFYKEESNDRDK